jgi:hypothetical protein
MLLAGILLLPAVPARAESLIINSSTFASSSISSTIAHASDWLDEKFGVDLFEILNKVIAFVLSALKISINVLMEILPKIKEFLSNL